MDYGFEVESINVKKGLLSREERNDIIQYVSSATVEADGEKKAFRQLANRINGRLARESDDKLAVITLPDYSNCQLVLRARVAQ